jgi:hypothetical protein
VTIDATGALGGTGTIAGNVANAGGAIKPGAAPGVMTIVGNLGETMPSDLAIELGGTTPGTEYSQLIVDGTTSLSGKLDLSLVEGFSLTSGETFDIVGTGDGLTNDLTSLSLDGRACWAAGGGFECNATAFFDFFTPLDARSRHAGRRHEPGRSRAWRHDDAGARSFDMGDDAGRVRGPGLPHLPGFAQGRGGGVSATSSLLPLGEGGPKGRMRACIAQRRGSRAKPSPQPSPVGEGSGQAVSPDSDWPLRWPAA